MIQLGGYWYDGRSSARQAVGLRVDESGHWQVRASDDDVLLASGSLEELQVSTRLGNSARFLDFASGHRLETAENEAVDRIFAQHAPRRGRTLLHQIESHKRFVLLSFVLIIGFIWWFVVYGAPGVARIGAEHVPRAVVETVAEQTLKALDEQWFAPSELSPEVRQRVLSHFQPTLERYAGQQVRVLFRASEVMGPNALALPDGTVIFTDAMVRLAEHDDELRIVLAHEIGHVVERHSMRRIIQDSMLAFMVALIAGDISGTAELFLGLPILLTELAYSREMEREADDFALAYAQAQGLAPSHFANLMQRLQAARRCEGLEGEAAESCREQPVEEQSDSWGRYLSTHPHMLERLERFR